MRAATGGPGHVTQSLRLKVVAEGVETLEPVDFLRERGCREMQGYYFGEPRDAEGEDLMKARAPWMS